MYYSTIKWVDVANGTGIRLSLFVSGCTHGCLGCFNPQSWSFTAGQPYTAETQETILEKLSPQHMWGLSLLGGEPLDPQNQETVLGLLQAFRERYPEKTVWCYTGYLAEALLEGQVGDFSKEILALIDILVDGPFVAEKKNLSLRFRGSENQRILNMRETLSQGKMVFSDEN